MSKRRMAEKKCSLSSSLPARVRREAEGNQSFKNSPAL
jgi:hypothetical protein